MTDAAGPIPPAARPRLAPGVRLQTDRVSGSPVLLYPEGMLQMNPTGAAIVDAVTQLAHVLGLSVTAEGVETTAQHEQILRLGCDHAQGFLYGAPMPRHELSALLAAGHDAPLSQNVPSRPTPTSAARLSVVPEPVRRA